MAMIRFSCCSLYLATLLVVPVTTPADFSPNEISLAGTWRVRLDPENAGDKLAWYAGRFDGDPMFLPGSTDEAGLGVKISSPAAGHLSRPYTYTGVAWYQRDIVIPAPWTGKRVSLFLDRPHWETRVWVDGQEFGTQNSLSTPHVYDVTAAMRPGRHTLTIAVDNSLKINVGRLAHSVTDATQTNWNGIVGRIALRATDLVWIESVAVYPETGRQAIRMEVGIRNESGQAVSGRLNAWAPSTNAGATFELGSGASRAVELVVPSSGERIEPWDEYEPNLYEIGVALEAIGGEHTYADRWTMRWGRRDITTRHKQFILNDRPIFLRGALECAIFPLTGYPPMRVEGWERVFRIARKYGLNHLRFHSWCPPEAAFEAADRAGFLLHVELPVWSHNVGQDPELDKFMKEEAQRILKTYGNHPSFTMLCLGNELSPDFDWMDAMVADLKKRDPRRLYTFSADYRRKAAGPTSDYYVTSGTKIGPVRIHGSRFRETTGGTDFDFSDHVGITPMPLVAHELGQWVVYPSYEEIAKYTGVLKAKNLEAFRDKLAARGMLDQAKAFQLASGRFSWLVYKEDIEAALRTPKFGGVQLLQLQDFPGQGEALVGLLDSFWETKGILTPAEFRRFFSETVPLARFPKFTWTNDESFTAKIQVAHYGKKPLEDAVATWTLAGEDEREIGGGRFGRVDIALGSVTELGEVSCPLAKVQKAERLRLSVKLANTEARNDWDIWVYPDTVESAVPPGVSVSHAWDSDTIRRLKQGKKVLLLWPAGQGGKNVMKITFLPVFWSTVHFGGRYKASTLGIFTDPNHPALASFPTDFHSNWQWWELTEGSPVFILNDTPPDFRPIVQVIDDFHRNNKLGAVFETRVGKGRLLVCSFDIESNLDRRPVARQLRHSLFAYMSSEYFRPEVQIEPSVLQRLFEPGEAK